MKANRSVLNNSGISRAGFTLMEVLIALTILAVGFLAVAQMQITGLKANQFAMELTEGVTWAQDRMEVLMGLPFDDPLLDDTGGTPREDDDPPRGFSIFWTVDDDAPVTGAKRVDLTASWRNEYGRMQTVRLVGVKNEL
jgi:type IV pilus assembly protein PilV